MIFILQRIQTLSVNNINDNLVFSLILHFHLLKLKLKIQSRNFFCQLSSPKYRKYTNILIISQEYKFKPITLVHCEMLTSFSRLLDLIKNLDLIISMLAVKCSATAENLLFLL